MRLPRAVGLPSMAITAIALSLGMSPAVAEGTTAICGVAETPCAAPYPAAPTRIEAEAVTPTIVTSTGTITCEKSTFSGNAAGESGASIALTSMVFLNCELESTNPCYINPLSLGELSLAGLGGYSGDATLSGTVLQVSCGVYLKVSCEYGGEPVLHVLSTTGEEAATFSLESSLVAEGGIACPEESEWLAEYRVTLPESLYISGSEEGTSLCTTEESPCKAPYPAGYGTHFETVASEMRLLAGPYFSVVCESAKLAGEFAGDLGEPIVIDIISAAFEGCTYASIYSCTMKTGLGQLEISPSQVVLTHATLLVQCGPSGWALSCMYVFTGEGAPAWGGLPKEKPPGWDNEWVALERVLAFCPTLTLLDSRFSLALPEAAYLSS